jgi:hypothetical protein
MKLLTPSYIFSDRLGTFGSSPSSTPYLVKQYPK